MFALALDEEESQQGPDPSQQLHRGRHPRLKFQRVSLVLVLKEYTIIITGVAWFCCQVHLVCRERAREGEKMWAVQK